jgi:hypothetical protein
MRQTGVKVDRVDRSKGFIPCSTDRWNTCWAGKTRFTLTRLRGQFVRKRRGNKWTSNINMISVTVTVSKSETLPGIPATDQFAIDIPRSQVASARGVRQRFR